MKKALTGRKLKRKLKRKKGKQQQHQRKQDLAKQRATQQERKRKQKHDSAAEVPKKVKFAEATGSNDNRRKEKSNLSKQSSRKPAAGAEQDEDELSLFFGGDFDDEDQEIEYLERKLSAYCVQMYGCARFHSYQDHFLTVTQLLLDSDLRGSGKDKNWNKLKKEWTKDGLGADMGDFLQVSVAKEQRPLPQTL